jgi:hypothetical protein
MIDGESSGPLFMNNVESSGPLFMSNFESSGPLFMSNFESPGPLFMNSIKLSVPFTEQLGRPPLLHTVPFDSPSFEM